MSSRLIVNADDCNLTRGVTRGILRAHDQGIVSSTTVLINLPLESDTVRALTSRRRLGVGLHLNVTLGTPVNQAARVRSLIHSSGFFRRPADYGKRKPSVSEVIREYDAQILLFQRRFGRNPDHLDTHHHLHDDQLFFEALAACARKRKIPVRRSKIFQLGTQNSLTRGLKTTDYLFGNLEARTYWQRESFLGIVENLPPGTNEMGCHPGFCDRELREISSMQEVREREFNLFSDSRLRKLLRALGIPFIRFSDI